MIKTIIQVTAPSDDELESKEHQDKLPRETMSISLQETKAIETKRFGKQIFIETIPLNDIKESLVKSPTSTGSKKLRDAQEKSNVFSPDSVGSPAAPTFSKKRIKSDREVLVGTPVKEGHVNYMLMYDMLTGIRISVSRCNAKMGRDAMDDDFAAAHKLAFDV